MVYYKYWKKSAFFLYFEKKPDLVIAMSTLKYFNGTWLLFEIFVLKIEWTLRGVMTMRLKLLAINFYFFLHMNIQMYSSTFIIFAAIFFPCNRGSLIWILPFFRHDFFWQLQFSEINDLIDLICKFITSWPLIHSNLIILRKYWFQIWKECERF